MADKIKVPDGHYGALVGGRIYFVPDDVPKNKFNEWAQEQTAKSATRSGRNEPNPSERLDTLTADRIVEGPGGKPLRLPLTATDSDIEAARNRSEIMSFQAAETSPIEAFNVAANKTGAQLWTGLKNILPDSIGGNEEENIRKHEEGFEAYEYLKDQYPVITAIGATSPYMLPIGKALSVPGKFMRASPKASQAYQTIKRATSPTMFNLAEVARQYPKTMQGLYGAAVGEIDPYDNPLFGAAAGVGGAYAGEKFLSRFVQPRKLTTGVEDEIIDWAKRNDYKPTAGTQFKNPTLRMEENAAKLYKDTADSFAQVVREQDQNTSRLLLHNVFGVPGDELNSKTLGTARRAVKNEIDDAIGKIEGHGNFFRQKLDEVHTLAEGTVPGKSAQGLTQTEWDKFLRVENDIREILGKDYITGDTYQRMQEVISDSMKKADIGSNLHTRLRELQTGMDDAVELLVTNNAQVVKGMSPEEAAKYAANRTKEFRQAKEKYAAVQLLSRHTESGNLSYSGLREELRAYNPEKFGIDLPPEGTPMGQLHRIALYDDLTKGRGASLSASEEFGAELRSAPIWKRAKLEMGLRGQTPQHTNNPFGFRSNIHLGGRIGSADNRQNPISPTTNVLDYALESYEDPESAFNQLKDKVTPKFQSLMDMF